MWEQYERDYLRQQALAQDMLFGKIIYTPQGVMLQYEEDAQQIDEITCGFNFGSMEIKEL